MLHHMASHQTSLPTSPLAVFVHALSSQFFSHACALHASVSDVAPHGFPSNFIANFTSRSLCPCAELAVLFARLRVARLCLRCCTTWLPIKLHCQLHLSQSL